MLFTFLISAVVQFATAAYDTLDVAKVTASSKVETSASVPVQRLSDEELRRAGAVYLHEVVRGFAGISVKDYGGIGGLKTVSIRNMGTAHTMISYDGIAISDAQNGQVDIGRFFLDDLAEVRITIGQEDDIFKSARLAAGSGTLYLRSRAPEFGDGNSIRFKAGVSYGSFGTFNPKFSYQHRLGSSWALTANGSWLTSKGDYPFAVKNGDIITEEIRLNSDVNTVNAEVNFYGSLNDGSKLTAKANYHSCERGLPGSVVLYTQNPTERLWDRNLITSLRYENTFSPVWRFETSVSYVNAWNRYLDKSALYAEPQDDTYTQQELALAAVAQYSPWERVGFSVAEDLFYNVLDSDIPECPFPRRISSLTAVSAQYAGPRLKATATLLGTYMHEYAVTGAVAPDRHRLSPSASLSYGFAKNRLRLRASYKDGFRVPTFNDLYYARVGNTALLPEKARQLNVGATWNSSHGSRPLDISLTADGYVNSIRDKIVATPTMFIWKMRNVGKVRMAGVDVSASARWETASWITMYARGNWSYQYAVDITDPEAKNWKHQIPYTPCNTGNAALSVETSWITVTYTLNAVGKRYALAQNLPTNRIAGYADHGVSLNRTFCWKRMGLSISLEALNLSDDNYHVIRFYPMPGRNYRVTLRIFNQ